MPKYGLLTKPTNDVVSEINKFGRLGFDYTEIGLEEPLGTNEILRRDRKNILAALKKNKMFALGHTAYWVDFGTAHEDVRAGWVKEAKEMIEVSSLLGIKLLNFHFFPGTGGLKHRSVGYRKIFLKNFVKSMREISTFARTKGITLMLENEPSNRRNPYTIKEFEYIIKHVPNLMVHLDIAHAFTEGGNAKIDEYIRKFSKKLVHIHAHDNHGKKDEHLPLGRGKINFKKVASSLKKINYEKTITFEVFTSDLDAKKSRIRFQKIWDKV